MKGKTNNTAQTIQDIMKRISGQYFKTLGKYKNDELINKFLDYVGKKIGVSILYWTNDD